MTSTVPAALARLMLGWAFAAAALWWVLSVQPAEGPAATVLGRELTKADLPALPLLVTGALLNILAVMGRRARAATASTLLLSLSGVTGWIAMWWLAIEPTGDGAVVAPLTPRHGITESDLVAIPTAVFAVACGVVGLIELWRSASPYPPTEGPDAAVSVETLFGSTE